MDDMRLVVMGASGRMGRALVAAIDETPGLVLHAAVERPGSAALGSAVGTAGVVVTEHLEPAIDGAEGIVDFTAPATSVSVATLAARRGLVHVIGTTGCSGEDDAAIAACAASGARIVKSGNMSLGVNLLAGLVRLAARSLPADAFDIEVLEMHHRHKVDAPSGTALLLGQAAAEGRGVSLGDASVRVRDGHTGARVEGTIGFAALRGGSVIGDHEVILAGEGERLVLSHYAGDRTIFARGALRAAVWARGQAAGFYSMQDVLGLD